jgi:pimeloyl-ACP methyl ester carboxylesterase
MLPVSQATGSTQAASAGQAALVPHYPGRLVELSGGERVYVATTEPFQATADAIPGAGGVIPAMTEDNPGAATAVIVSPAAVVATVASSAAPASTVTVAPAATTIGGPPPADRDGSTRESVLCVHGMAGSATNWTELMSLLAPEFSCDAVDLPGSGWSPPPATMAGYSIGALAATVTKVIEQRGTGPVHLVGNSMGGLVSVKVAAGRPDLVRTLTLISPALPDRRIRLSHAQFPLLSVPGLGDWLLRRGDAYPAENRVWGVMGMIFYDPSAVHPERFRQAVQEMERRDQLAHRHETLVGAARAITAEYLRPARARGNAWRAARQVHCPVLAIYGSHDRLVNPRMAGRAARAFPDGRVIVLPGTGHVAQMEHPARVAAEFADLARAARAASAAR